MNKVLKLQTMEAVKQSHMNLEELNSTFSFVYCSSESTGGC